MQKIKFMPPFLQDILQRYCKLVILGTLKKRWYQLCCLENFGVYLHAKNQVHSSPLFWNITKTWQTWNFLNWGCFTTPTKNNKITLTETFVYLHAKKWTWSLTSFLRYHTSKNPAIWLVENILVHNFRTRILPDKGFAVNYK